jgi:tetratricopeptide (TPR) repeat protein
MISGKSATRGILAPLCLIAAVLLSANGAFGQESQLGTVDFPTSGTPEAQRYFLRGLGALHSFWFEEALDNFTEATKIDPDFMMGYWGQAMSYNHPLWAQQDTEAARKVVAKIHDTSRLTPREKAYLSAVKVLYGDGDKLARDIAYSDAMAGLYRDYPNDMEAACFYALSLLGTVRPGDKGYKRQMLAGAIALEVYGKNPNHPGAAHYIIHAFDDPDHAILALPAARRYAQIAPEAHHARHMPSHIFLQLGMWPEAAASNESSWATSDAWVKRKNLSIALRDYHSLHWLTYVYLQQGRDTKAAALITLLDKAILELGAEAGSSPMQHSLQNMSAAYVIETESWDKAAELFNQSKHAGSGDAQASPHDAGAHAASGAAAQGMAYHDNGDFMALFVKGFAAAQRGTDDQTAGASLHSMAAESSKAGQAYRGKQLEILALEIDAVSKAHGGDFDSAVELMKKAVSIEDEMSPPSGPPDSIKPPRELLGEILLRAGHPKEALQQFDASLSREPNRARSLLGRARALARAGDSVKAKEAYASFLEVWKQADSQLPELAEAHGYLEQAAGQ